MLIKTAIAAALLSALPVQTAPEPPAPQENWLSLPPAAPAPVTQEEAALMRQYIALLEGAVLKSRNELDDMRQRYPTCQGRGRT